ncbi:deoxyribodipyrimidine photolyase [bacterium]|nr:deoxyribodipyrimidine photolyase [bacterium]
MRSADSGLGQLVWFKRDLRIHDHAPLTEAARRGPVLGLYVYEPSVVRSSEFDFCHLQFINESLAELSANLSARGGRLVIAHGEIVPVLERLRSLCQFNAIWSHEETGNDVTYRRDLAIGEWCRSHGIAWHELPQTGVVRRLRSRDGWSRIWARRMADAPLPAPATISSWDAPAGRNDSWRQHLAGLDVGILDAGALGVAGVSKPEAWHGGEANARKVLASFLDHRGVNYQREMSSPVTAFDSCSRLSPYLAWGNISMRAVHNAARDRVAELREQQAFGMPVDRRWFMSIRAFEARLRWHCHFMQKLESEPAIEFHNMMRSLDGLREAEFDESRFSAWCAGETGFPMVDASMRALHRGGWINFRMRAMLVSFAAWHLWLHWRRPAVFLARHFIDFEPGIHFSQFQMQSGTTGINALRIYSPAKQVLDHDPSGVFIRKYVPELAGIPDEFLAEPHLMPAATQKESGCVIGKDYPAPLVDHKTAWKAARERVSAFRKSAGPALKDEKKAVLARHGSRKKTGKSG